MISLTRTWGRCEKIGTDRRSIVRRFRQVTAPLAALQPFDQFSPERAIETLLRFKGKTDKLHAKLMTLHPFDRAEIDGECRRLMVEEHTHAHVTTAEDFSVAHDGTTLQRQVRQNTFSNKWCPAEDDRIVERKPVVGSNVPTRCHQILPVGGWYSGRPCDRYPTLGGEGAITDPMTKERGKSAA